MAFDTLDVVQDGSIPLQNPDYERFAQGLADGMSAGKSYRKNVAERGTSMAICMVNASQLLAKIRLRADFLKARVSQIAAEKYDFGKEKLVGYLIEVLETPIGELDESHPLTAEVTSEWKGGRQGQLMRGDAPDGNENAEQPYEVVKVKGFGKAEAAKQLATLAGWNAPDKVEHSGTVAMSVEVAEALASVLPK